MIRQSFVSVTLVVIVSWFLVVWESPPESFMKNNVSQINNYNSVDSYMTDSTSRRFAENGALLFLLTSSKMELLSGSAMLKLSAPKFVSVAERSSNKNTGVSFIADNGSLSSDGASLNLDGNVQAFISGIKNQSVLTSARLNYDGERRFVTASDKFTLKMPNSVISGTGLMADLNKEIFTIKSKLISTHDPI